MFSGLKDWIEKKRSSATIRRGRTPMLSHTEQTAIRDIATELEMIFALVRRRTKRKHIITDPVHNTYHWGSEPLLPEEYTEKQHGIHQYNRIVKWLICPHVSQMPEIVTVTQFLSDVGTLLRFLQVTGVIPFHGSGYPILPKEEPRPRRRQRPKL